MKWTLRIRDFLCFSYLFLLAIFEGYGGIVTLIDPFASSVERRLGFLLALVSCELFIGSALLFGKKAWKFGFFLVALNVLLYGRIVVAEISYKNANGGKFDGRIVLTFTIFAAFLAVLSGLCVRIMPSYAQKA
jgi:hypothetical protein